MRTDVAAIAKITRPTLADIYPRRRLFRLLERGRKKPVTWVSGPAGSGKTTLVTSYIETRGLPCLWYQIDEGDADLATFFYYLGLAGKKAAPRYRKRLPLLTSEYLLDVPTFSRRYFENLISRLQTPFTLVFDNYQLIPASSPFHEILQAGLSSVPGGIHVVIISREAPPPAFTRMLAGNAVDVIGWEELRLTAEESRGISLLLVKTIEQRELISWMYEKTDGWAAGLILFIKALGREAVVPQTLPSMPPEKIFEYFANELFEKFDEEIRDFLLKTCVLPKMTAPIAEQLTGNKNADRMLSELNRKNYFTEKRRLEGDAYQYHPLFREFLDSRARQSYSQAEFRGIRRQAALLLMQAGHIEDAARLFIQSEGWEELASLALTHAPDFVSQGRGQSLADWIRRIPESLCVQTPFLYYWLGISLMPYDPNESLRLLETAFHLFQNKKDATGIYLSFSGAVEATTQCYDTFTQFDRWISILYKLRAEFKDFPSEEIEAHVATSTLFMFCLRQPQHPDYEVWSERALSVVQTIKKDSARLYFPLVGYRLFSGELKKAALLINSLREAAQTSGTTPLTLIMLKDAQAFYDWLAADFEGCSKAANDGLDLASSKGIPLYVSIIAGHGAAGELSEGNMERAERFLRVMTSRQDLEASWGKGFYRVLMTWKALLENDLPQALLHAESGLELSLKAGQPQTTAVCHLGMALVMHELRKEKEASAHISEVRKISRSTNIYQVEFRCLLAEAQFAVDRGDKNSARDFLRRAMSLGREQGYVNTYYWLPSVMARLCVEALEAGIEPDYVRNLVRKRNLVPDTPPLECENWPWPVKIYTFGRFSLLENGKPLRFSGKGQKKPLDMLKAVIALGGREVGEQQITDALWPEAEGNTGRMLFKTTLYRLRQLMENCNVITICEGRLSLDSRQCWVDAWVFERLLGEADKIWLQRSKLNIAGPAGDKAAEAVTLTEKAVAMYKGHFLEADRNEPWQVSLCEHLRMKYVRAVGRLGYHWEQERKHEKAIDCYQSGLHVDELTEEFYQHLMNCYLKLGRKAEAVKTYRRCSAVLKANMGLEPSHETTALYRTITQ